YCSDRGCREFHSAPARTAGLLAERALPGVRFRTSLGTLRKFQTSVRMASRQFTRPRHAPGLRRLACQTRDLRMTAVRGEADPFGVPFGAQAHERRARPRMSPLVAVLTAILLLLILPPTLYLAATSVFTTKPDGSFDQLTLRYYQQLFTSPYFAAS